MLYVGVGPGLKLKGTGDRGEERAALRIDDPLLDDLGAKMRLEFVGMDDPLLG